MPTIGFGNGVSVVVTATPPVHDPAQTLYVAAAYSNPHNWRSRRVLFAEFMRYMRALPNVRLFVGELAYGTDPFHLTSAANPDHLQLRANQILWHKENILNLVIAKKFPANWQYGAYCDGDFSFSRRDLATATIKMLQTNDWVQLFSDYTNLSADQRMLSNNSGFAWCRKAGKPWQGNYGNVEVGAPGGAWGFRRDAFEASGALIDFCITGSADWHMAFGLYGIADAHPTIKYGSVGYVQAINAWQLRAFTVAKRGTAHLDCHATHYWHGAMIDRGYATRWQTLKDNNFDPARDLYPNAQGVLQLRAAQQPIADAILKYFAAMNSDAA
jgi:hypothetical protein